MCCFAQPVRSVTDTNIFARLTGSHTQVLAYQMQFATDQPNAMILPLPVALPAREDSVRFIALDGYDGFFQDLARGFPDPPPPRAWLGTRVDVAAAMPADPLVVHEVGDFIASFVPTLADFSRLDPQFVIPRESWERIPEYGDYGFAVFQLQTLAGRPHPMAFAFDTRWNDRLFFPTVHIHDGEVHAFEHFDHTLYLQDARFDALVGNYVDGETRDRATGWVRSKYPAFRFCRVPDAKGIVDPQQLVHRTFQRGNLPNRDVLQLVANITPGRVPAPVADRWWSWPLAGGAAAMAGLGWLFHRRSRLMGQRNQPPA